jgi:hypothetical protein
MSRSLSNLFFRIVQDRLWACRRDCRGILSRKGHFTRAEKKGISDPGISCVNPARVTQV